jgi:hypothetical protein
MSVSTSFGLLMKKMSCCVFDVVEAGDVLCMLRMLECRRVLRYWQ